MLQTAITVIMRQHCHGEVAIAICKHSYHSFNEISTEAVNFHCSCPVAMETAAMATALPRRRTAVRHNTNTMKTAAASTLRITFSWRHIHGDSTVAKATSESSQSSPRYTKCNSPLISTASVPTSYYSMWHPLLAGLNVKAHPSTVSVPTLYYSMWHYNCLWSLKG